MTYKIVVLFSTLLWLVSFPGFIALGRRGWERSYAMATSLDKCTVTCTQIYIAHTLALTYRSSFLCLCVDLLRLIHHQIHELIKPL